MGTKTTKSAARRKLEEIEAQSAAELERRKRKKKRYPKGAKTRIAKDVRARKRRPPPVPEGKTAAEIREMDPDDPAFKHPNGRPRKPREKAKKEDIEWTESIKQGKQKRTNGRRARVRKHEAEVMATVTDLETVGGRVSHKSDVDDETVLVEEGYLSLDDWDTEELIRGYRRNRKGSFGKPPKYVPRELQQEILRRLLRHGERKLHQAFISSLDDLIDLAQNADSEKVKLEAIREILNRVVGKVPERINIAADAPYQDMLADSLVPVSDLPPLELETGADGVARAAPIEVDVDEGTFEAGDRDA